MTNKMAMITGFGILGLAAGVVISMSLLSPGSINAETSHAPKMVFGIRATEEYLVAEAALDQAIKEELSGGCIEYDAQFHRELFCGESKIRIDALNEKLKTTLNNMVARTEVERAPAIAEIRDVLGNATEDIVYKETSPTPYKMDYVFTETYSARGFVFDVDPKTNTIVQFGPGPDWNGATITRALGEKQLSQEELRTLATAFIGSMAKDLPLSELTAKIEQKSDIIFFRFDRPQGKVRDGEIPPFVQVGIETNGAIVSFTNTITL